jgi:hypothetical protein
MLRTARDAGDITNAEQARTFIACCLFKLHASSQPLRRAQSDLQERMNQQ